MKLTPITISLIRKNLFFDYATEYYYAHPEISDAKDFKLSDEEYAKFVQWLSGRDYDYVTEVEQTIDDLIESAKDEKYYDDIEEQIIALRKKVQHNKELDLKKFKEEVKVQLEQEIVSRYYLEQGQIENAFDDDPVVQAAIEVLNDAEKYNSLLAGPK